MEYSDRLKRSLSGHAKRTLQKQREEGALKKNTKITEHFQFRATPVEPTPEPESDNDVTDNDILATADNVSADEESLELNIGEQHVCIVPSVDIGLLGDNPSSHQVDQFVKQGPQQPKPSVFPIDANKHGFPAKVLTTTLSNGEVTSRDWLAYSPSKQSLYCFPCRLFYKEVIRETPTPSLPFFGIRQYAPLALIACSI